jgi:hypothetical protein
MHGNTGDLNVQDAQRTCCCGWVPLTRPLYRALLDASEASGARVAGMCWLLPGGPLPVTGLGGRPVGWTSPLWALAPSVTLSNTGQQ